MIDFSKYLVHSSAYGNLLTEPKAKADKDAGLLSATVQQYLWEVYLEEKYQRKKEITTRYMEKGILQEEQSITVYCRWAKKLYYKNEQRITNKYLTGEIDLTDNEDIYKTFCGIDIKTSWDIFTFPKPNAKPNPMYEAQNLCYMDLTGAQEWKTSSVLVNAPQHQIMDEKRKLMYKLNCSEHDEEYIKACQMTERNMIFNMAEFRAEPENKSFDFHTTDWCYDIPLKERVRECHTKRDKDFIEAIPYTVGKARDFLNGLAKNKA